MIEKLPFKVDVNAMREALQKIQQLPITCKQKNLDTITLAVGVFKVAKALAKMDGK